MSLASLFNQTILIYPTASYGADGRQTFGSPVTVRGRVQLVSKRALMPDRSTVVISAIVYVPANTVVSDDNRADYNGGTYKVFSRSEAIDGRGQVNHIKLELIKWQVT